MKKHHGLLHIPDTADETALPAWYPASEADDVMAGASQALNAAKARIRDLESAIKRQAASAIAGMNAATAISSGQLQQAHRLRAESSPEALESERQANAILTERVAELELANESLRAVISACQCASCVALREENKSLMER